MSKTLLNVFEEFYDDLPATVHYDLSFMMVMLSDEEFVADESETMDERARSLFGARTFIGSLRNLINAVSIFDVYFALDTNKRFGFHGSQRDHYADQRQAILASKQVWMELRRTSLSPEAIAAALVPANSTTHREYSSPAIRAEHSGVP
jgi:hypothetical protein